MKSYSLAIRLVICTLVIFLSAAKLPAQIDRSTISGTVTDPSGAVVPGATVVVTNTATSESVTPVSYTHLGKAEFRMASRLASFMVSRSRRVSSGVAVRPVKGSDS